MKVFLSACGEGFGHSSRMAAVMNALKREKHDGIIATYGKPLERLKSMGYRTFETQPEFSMVGKAGKFDLMGSIIASTGNSAKYWPSINSEMAQMKKMGAEIVISDSRLATAIAASMAGIPVLYVCNQTWYYKKPSDKFDLSDFQERTVGTLMSTPLAIPPVFSDMILIPDFAPPETVCLPLLSRDKRLKKMTYFTGPMSLATNSKPKTAGWKSQKTKVLITMGGQAFRKGEYDQIRSLISKSKKMDFLMSSVFVEKDEKIGNAKFKRYLPKILPYQMDADILVMPAGHSAIMESIVLGKPMLLLPDEGQPEQLSNAKRISEMGLGEYLEISEMDEFTDKLDKIAKNKKAYSEKLKKLSSASKFEMDGAQNVVRMCKEYLRRLNY